MVREVQEAVREACLWLPESEEFVSHGSPNFRVRGKTYATYTVNHHGDGRVALWLNAPPGSQELHVGADPKSFFIPAYVGSRGWLGVILNSSIKWSQVLELIREAYEKTAPKELVSSLGKTPRIKPADRAMTAQQIDPFKSAGALGILKKLREICMKFPEASLGTQFGNPVWLAGKKTFVIARHEQGRLTLCFWVGVEAQSMLTADPRFSIPSYFGHNGWIALYVTHQSDWREIAALTEQSHRHFAMKRMLASMASKTAPNTPD